jgi:hypothetical protein
VTDEKDPQHPEARPVLRRGAPKNGKIGNRGVMAADNAAIQARRIRRTKALELEILGTPRSQIAKQLGIGPRQVRRDLERAVQEMGTPNLEHLRAVNTARLEQAILDTHMAIGTLRALALKHGSVPNLEASRTFALHARNLRGLVAELSSINGLKVAEKHDVNVKLQAEVVAHVSPVSFEHVLTVVERNRGEPVPMAMSALPTEGGGDGEPPEPIQ